MAVNGVTDQDLKSVADYQQLVEDIESLMASPNCVDVASVIRLHSIFEQAAKSVNSRLRECDQLLKKGLRNEALERCGTEPNLLELFLILDFPERDSWNATTLQCGLTSTELLVGIAGDLNDAIVTEKPLAELKYQVRLHALARSPLSIRIRLMRKLARADQTTSLWEDDLKAFERARHTQLHSEIKGAINSGNANALNSLHEELRSPDWIQPPAKGLLKQVNDAIAVLRRDMAREELEKLEPELVAAFAAFDVQRGRELRASWEHSADEAALPASDPLLQQVIPALQWLRDQDQQERDQSAYDQAIAALVQVLDKGADRLTLEQKYHSLLALGRGIPDEIRQRLEERLIRLDRDRNRSLMLRIAGVIATVCILSGIAVLMTRQARFQNDVQAEVAILKKMLDDKQLSEADAYLTKLDVEFPHIAGTTEIQQIRSDLKMAQEKEAVRRVEFQTLLAAAQREGLEHSTLQSIPAALQSLSKAWDLALYSSEKTQVKDLSKSVEERQSSLQQAADDQFAGDMVKMKNELAVLKSAPLDNLAALQLLRSEAGALMEREGASTEARDSKGMPIVVELDQTIQKGLKQQSEARLLKEINASIGDRSKFFSHLEKYSTSPEFIGTTRANDFQRVTKSDAVLVTGYQNWSTFLEAFMRRDVTSLDSGSAVKLRNEGEKFIKDHPGFPYAGQLQNALAYLGKSAAREHGSPVMEQLLNLKAFKLLSLRCEGKRYYLAAEPATKDAKPGLARFYTYYTDTEFKTTKQERLTNVESEPGWRSPQMLFEIEAGDLLSKLRDGKGTNWDQTFIELLGKLFNSSMDPILKIQLIPHVLNAAGEGSSFLPKRMEKHAGEIERQKLNPSTNWVFPDDAEANQVRIRAETILKRMAGDLHDVKELLSEAEQFRQSLKHPKFDIRFVWTAWLHRDYENKWTCTFRGNAPLNSLSSDLYVLQRSEAGEVTFVRIGQSQQGQVKIDTSTAELLEGRPVFEKKPEPGAP